MLVRCPICLWNGPDWSEVESRPRVVAKKACPRCGGYPRDRIVFVVLQRVQQSQPDEKLVVGEIGGSAHSYSWKKKGYRYWNADVEGGGGRRVDVLIEGSRMKERPVKADVGILSYVLSEVRAKSDRIGLMKEFHKFTVSNGVLILFDDLALKHRTHRTHPKGMFFHTVQLGRPILEEATAAGWIPAIVNSLPLRNIKAEIEMPFMLAAKSKDVLDGLVALITGGEPGDCRQACERKGRANAIRTYL
jgi:hypothetical protein